MAVARSQAALTEGGGEQAGSHETGRRITAMALSPNAQHFAAVCLGGVLCVWDAQSRLLLKSLVERPTALHKMEFESVTFTHDGARLVVAGAVRHRNELVPGLEANVHKLISGFIREYSLDLSPLSSSSVPSTQLTALHTLHLGRGPLTSLTPAWFQPRAPAAEASRSRPGMGYVFARVPSPLARLLIQVSRILL